MMMKVESAVQTRDWLQLVIDGKPAWVDTKASLLEAGIVVLLDPEGADPYWEDATAAVLPADPADGRHHDQVIHGATDEPAIVALARRYHQAKNAEGGFAGEDGAKA